MKILVSAIVAGGLVAATMGGAAADQWRGPHRQYGPPPPPPQYYYSGNAAGAAVAGAFLGYALGALLTPRAPVVVYPQPVYPAYAPPPVYYSQPAYDPHAAWCEATYGASYNYATDSVIVAYGPGYRCVSPGGAAG